MTYPTLELYRLPQLKVITGLGASSIWARINPDAPQFDPDFPKPICLSATGKGAVAWRSDEVEAWIQRRTTLSRQFGQPLEKTMATRSALPDKNS